MAGFDENAEYEPRNAYQHEEVAVSESSEDEANVRLVTIISKIIIISIYELYCLQIGEIPLPPSPQPGPSGLGRNNRVVDDGQSYQAAGATTDEDERGGDVEIIEVVRPKTPELITLESSSEEEAERPETPPTSRGKALKSVPSEKATSRKDKKLKTPTNKKKKRKREVSESSTSDSDSSERYQLVTNKSYERFIVSVISALKKHQEREKLTKDKANV